MIMIYLCQSSIGIGSSHANSTHVVQLRQSDVASLSPSSSPAELQPVVCVISWHQKSSHWQAGPAVAEQSRSVAHHVVAIYSHRNRLLCQLVVQIGATCHVSWPLDPEQSWSRLAALLSGHIGICALGVETFINPFLPLVKMKLKELTIVPLTHPLLPYEKEQSTNSWAEYSCCCLYTITDMPSMAPTAEKAQLALHAPSFLTGLTAPYETQSTLSWREEVSTLGM